MDRVRNLLWETDLRISEIACLAGIESPQNFSKYFAKAFHVTPTSFRSQTDIEKTIPSIPSAPANKVSIAVLPFLNLSNDPEQEYFSDVVTESLRQWRQNYLITAPADGKLVFLKSLTESQYLKAADTLSTLMPVEETCTATVEIPVRDMSKARIGQNVIIKLDDYPYQEFGMLEGKVISMEP